MSNEDADNSRANALRTDASSSTSATRVEGLAIFECCRASLTHRRVGQRANITPNHHLELWDEARPFGQPDEFGNAANLELRHQPAAVNLDGLFDGAERRGDLLVEPARHHITKHFVLAWRQF